MVGFSGFGSIKNSMLRLWSSWIWMVVVSILDHWFFWIGRFFGYGIRYGLSNNWMWVFLRIWIFSHWGQGFSKIWMNWFSWMLVFSGSFNRIIGFLFYIELDRFHWVGRLTHTFTQDGLEALEKSWKKGKIFFGVLIIKEIGSC